MYEIQWKGDKVKNYYSRRGYEPIAICNHITAGTAGSVYNWFTSPNNKQASSHFLVCRNGEIHQYVDIRQGAWTQGLSASQIPIAKAPIVKQMKVNPNYYMIGIEHEGYVEGHKNDDGSIEVVNYGLDGDLTEEQFKASLWLHKWVQEEVQRIYGFRIPLNSHNVVGHFQVDPVRKPFCPGPNFPWQRLYKELAYAEYLTLKELENKLTYENTEQYENELAFKIANQAKYLYHLMVNGNEGQKRWAKNMLLKGKDMLVSG